MTKSPLVTVAMVTYNSAKYVAAAIESVLAQSYIALELIIVDDASNDGTWEIVNRYVDKRIRAYRNASNIGEYPNRNRALNHALGEYLIYIDGDDILYPHGLEFMVRSLNEFPRCAMAMARPWSASIIFPWEVSPRDFYLHECLGTGAAGINFAHLLFRTNRLREVGGLPTKYRQGDLAIQYRIALEHHSLMICDGLAWWRRTPGQASEIVLKDHRGWIETLKFRKDFLLLPNCPLTVQERRIALTNAYGLFLRVVLRYLLKGRWVHAAFLLRHSGIPPGAWSCALIRAQLHYPACVKASSPLSSGIERNPYFRK